MPNFDAIALRGRVYTLDKRLLSVKQEGAVKKVTA
jgi:hypothetical protein